MLSSQGIGQRMAGIRQRLDALAEAPSTAPDPAILRLAEISRQVASLSRKEGDPLYPAASMDLTGGLPRMLCWRARRLLLRGRDLLERLRPLENACRPDSPDADSYRRTLAMTELALRSVQTFPEDTASQLSLCDGLECLLATIADRIDDLEQSTARSRCWQERLACLAEFHSGLIQERHVAWSQIQGLASNLLAEADAELPLEMIPAEAARPDHWSAAHALNTAQVAARLVRFEPELARHRQDAVAASLVLDAGMAALPPEWLGQPGPLTDDQMRHLETHPVRAAARLELLVPGEKWLADAVRAHHERQDGTGYPAGHRGERIPLLARFLSVCDVYAAMRGSRPWRGGRSPRAALTEALLEAERGRLDARLAELLLELTFYPVGTVVELSDSSYGVVVTTRPVAGDVALAARPIVRRIHGQPRSTPWKYVNLAAPGSRLRVVRGLMDQEAQFIPVHTLASSAGR